MPASSVLPREPGGLIQKRLARPRSPLAEARIEICEPAARPLCKE